MSITQDSDQITFSSMGESETFDLDSLSSDSKGSFSHSKLHIKAAYTWGNKLLINLSEMVSLPMQQYLTWTSDSFTKNGNTLAIEDMVDKSVCVEKEQLITLNLKFTEVCYW